MKEYNTNPLIPLGIGAGLGVTALWAAVELLPVAALFGAGYLVVKGLEYTKNKDDDESDPKENI